MADIGRRHPAEYTPLKLAVAWLAGTYLLFLMVGKTENVPDLFKLSSYVAFTVACFIAGYVGRIVAYRSKPPLRPRDEDDPKRLSSTKWLVGLSAAYYALYGIIYLGVYGINGPGQILNSITNPGGAYLSKFGVYEEQAATGVVSGPGQLITLAAVLSAPLVPLLVLSWNRIGGKLKVASATGLALYMAYFLSIGTMSGLGTVVILAVAATLVRRAGGLTVRKPSGRLIALVLLGITIFSGYMSYAQGERIAAVGIMGRYDPNPIAVMLGASDQTARGTTAALSYPSHGYEGLAYNLDTPFKWAEGRGASRALDSYLDQYGFGETAEEKTYPARTEARTGWPRGQYWATIYPWLASDLTFFGAAVFMAVAGWWIARWWMESVIVQSRLSLMLFCQSFIFIAFVPANNQLVIGRPSLICAASLLLAYGLSNFNRSDRARTATRSEC